MQTLYFRTIGFIPSNNTWRTKLAHLSYFTLIDRKLNNQTTLITPKTFLLNDNYYSLIVIV
jgi:hypothetical protein